MPRVCHIPNVLILCIDTAWRIIHGNTRLPNVQNISLLPPLKEFTEELLNDEYTADGLCRLVEHGKPILLLLVNLLTYLKVFSRELRQMMQFNSSSTQSECKHMH
jgi:hypothetical protein